MESHITTNISAAHLPKHNLLTLPGKPQIRPTPTVRFRERSRSRPIHRNKQIPWRKKRPPSGNRGNCGSAPAKVICKYNNMQRVRNMEFVHTGRSNMCVRVRLQCVTRCDRPVAAAAETNPTPHQTHTERITRKPQQPQHTNQPIPNNSNPSKLARHAATNT